MVVEGKVQNGVAVPTSGESLPEGANVTIIVQAATDPGDGSSVGKRLMKFAGTAKDLPADMAEQHDHYIHGQPKK